MAEYQTGSVGREMGAVPFGSLISGMALGIAEGQWALDKSSIRVAEMMSGAHVLRDLDTGKLLAANGSELPAGAEPYILDSRVYFGYDLDRTDADTTKVKVTVSADGKVTGIALDGGKAIGENYSFEPEVEILGTGTGATARAIVTNGRITQITVTNQGEGYTNDTSIRLSGGGGKKVPNRLSMIELGFMPNFYQFVDTVIEVKIVVTMTETTENNKVENTKENKTSNTDTSVNSYGWGWSWWRPYSTNYKRNEASAVTKTVDANYTSKYSYSVEGSSSVRTKLVAVPPPTILEDRIRQMMRFEEQLMKEKLRTDKLPSTFEQEQRIKDKGAS